MYIGILNLLLCIHFDYITQFILNLFRCLYVVVVVVFYLFEKSSISRWKTCMQKTKTEMKTKMILYAFIRVVIVLWTALSCLLFDSIVR